MACATVSRTVGSASGLLECGCFGDHVTLLVNAGAGGGRRPGVPGAAQPGVFGIIDDLPGPFGAGSGHHIEVVHVVARRGDGRAVIAVRYQHHVAGAHFFEHLDRAFGRAVDAVITEAARIIWAWSDFEVVDLLQRGLDGSVLVVLVRRIARPVAAGRDHLACDQRVRLENPCGAEVVHLRGCSCRCREARRARRRRRRGGSGVDAWRARRRSRTGLHRDSV